MRSRILYMYTIFLIVMTVWSSVSSSEFCKVKRKKYALGKSVPSKNPCENCTCEMGDSGKPEVMCFTIECAMLCDGRIVDDGSCCGKCEIDVEKASEVSEVSECDPRQCPKLRCSKRFQFKTDDMCCAQCKCRRRGKLYLPGPVGERCDGCRCDGSDGRVVCEPPKCPNTKLECVDPVKGDDCCYYCPNGKTCAPANSLKTVIKYGEYKKVKKNICACAGEPWYPYAFCASSKVNIKGLKGFSEFLAPYMNL